MEVQVLGVLVGAQVGQHAGRPVLARDLGYQARHMQEGHLGPASTMWGPAYYLRDVEEALLDQIGMFDDVVTFNISEFARTLGSNGNGSDHAWGGNALVMGGDVRGGDMYGAYPSLALGGNHDIHNGVLIPTTSNDSYFAELALWFGVGPSDLSTLFPNIGNFYDTGSSAPPMGFMNI